MRTTSGGRRECTCLIGIGRCHLPPTSTYYVCTVYMVSLCSASGKVFLDFWWNPGWVGRFLGLEAGSGLNASFVFNATFLAMHQSARSVSGSKQVATEQPTCERSCFALIIDAVTSVIWTIWLRTRSFSLGFEYCSQCSPLGGGDTRWWLIRNRERNTTKLS